MEQKIEECDLIKQTKRKPKNIIQVPKIQEQKFQKKLKNLIKFKESKLYQIDKFIGLMKDN